MAVSHEAGTEQLASSAKMSEALVAKLRELHMRVEMLRNTRKVSSEAAGLLDTLIDSAYLNAVNLKTSLEPISNSIPPAPETPEAEEKHPEKIDEGPTCHRCGMSVKEEYKLCPYCGYDLKPKSCDGCGCEVLPDFRFCPGCGKRLG